MISAVVFNVVAMALWGYGSCAWTVLAGRVTIRSALVQAPTPGRDGPSAGTQVTPFLTSALPIPVIICTHKIGKN